MTEKFKREKGAAKSATQPSTGRRVLLAILAVMAALAIAPAVSQASDGLNDTTTANQSINGKTVDFGSTLQLNLPVTRSIYLWTNTASGLFSTRRIGADITLAGTEYELAGVSSQSGSNATCSITNGAVGSQVFRVALVTTQNNTNYKACTINIRLKAGIPDGATYNRNLAYSAATGSNCSGSCSGWGGTGNTNPGNATLSGTVEPNVYSGDYRDTANLNTITSHDFGEVGVGGDAAYTVVLRNTGNAIFTNPNSQSFTGPQASDFSRTTTCGATLGVGATCNISVTYTPQALGASTANLVVSSGNAGPITLPLEGEGIPLVIQGNLQNTAGDTNLANYTYPDTLAGNSAPYVFTFRNTGNVALNNPNTQSLTGPDAGQFSRSTTCGATLAPNATCTVTVAYNPTVVQAGATATLNVNPTNGGASSVNLTATSLTPSPSMSIRDTGDTTDLTSRNFTANLGSNQAYVFTIKNTGDVALNGVTNQTVTGVNAAEFGRTTTCGATLAAGASCTTTITFTPTRSGPRTATLTVSPTHAIVTLPPKSVALNGQGTGVRILNDVNYNLTNVNQKAWLDTLSTGAQGGAGDTVRVAFEVDQAVADEIDIVQVNSGTTTNDTAPTSGWNNATGSNITVHHLPGSPQAFVTMEIQARSTNFLGTGVGNYGHSAGFLDLCLIGQNGKSDNRRAWFRLVTQGGAISNPVGSIIRFSNTTFSCSTNGPPIIYDQQVSSVGGSAPDTPMDAVAAPGEPISFSFKGASNGNVTGINWRIRNSRTGNVFIRTGSGWSACGLCYTDATFSAPNSRQNFTDTASGAEQTLDLPFGLPSRGRWIVEANPRTTDGSNDNAYFSELGSVLVNSPSASPTISLSGTPPARPHTDSSYNITATVADPADPTNAFNSQGGRPQVIEWDLNNDPDDGPAGDGFEVQHFGDSSTNLPAQFLTKAFDTTGLPPGPYTIRVRVTDNGAILADEKSRQSAVASSTFTINAPPVARSETVDLEADQGQPASVDFNADDADGDPYTVAVTPDPGNDGSVSGTGNTKDYNWPAAFTGTDVFPFTATDDKSGTGPTGTLTVRVRPNTTIDAAAPNGTNPVPANGFLGATTSSDAEFEFSSPQNPVVAFDCRLLLDGNEIEGWSSCSNSSTGDVELEDLDEDGLYRFEVRAINAEGQADGTPAFRTWRVDTTEPVVQVRTGPPTDQPSFQPRPTNDPTPSYSFQVDDRTPQEFATYECRIMSGLEAGNWKPCGAPSDPSGSAEVQFAGPGTDFGYEDPLEEDTYTIEVRATDDVGLTGPALVESFRVDLTPPVTSIASGPDGLINTRDVSFVISSTESNSTFACVLVGLNQGLLYDGLCPGGANPVFTGLADDSYTLEMTAIDPATNRDPDPPVANFEIDATDPETHGGDVDFGDGVTPSRRTQSRRITVSFNGTDSRQLQGFQCRIDSSDELDWNTCQSPETYSGLADGEHLLEIRAKDQAGNVDQSPIEIEWTIDRTPPVTTIDSGPDDVTNDDDVEIAFSTNEDATSECRLDGGPWSSCADPLAVRSLNGGNPLADGTHTVKIRATDLAENLELTPASVTWEQDTVVPEVEIVAAPAPFVPLGDADFGWTVKDGDPLVLSPDAASECDYDGNGWEDCDRTLTIADPGNGVHEFKVRATDAAGNVSVEAVHNWEVRGQVADQPTIDNSDPTDGAVTRLKSATFAFSHVDEGALWFDGYECQVDSGAWSDCESPVHLDGLGDGSHAFSVRVKDEAGNRSGSASQAWEVRSGAPVTSIDSAPSGLTRQRSATLVFSSNKAGTFECRIDGSSWVSCSSPLELTDLDDGEHSIQVRAISSVSPVGVKDPTPSIRSWTIDGTSPETSIDSAPSGSTQSRSATFTFSSDDPTATFQCSFDAGIFNACSSPYELNDLSLGLRNLRIRAIDPAGNMDESPAEVEWTIVAPPPGTCPPGTQGTPPNCDPIPDSRLEATLTGGSLSLAALGEVALPAGQLKLVGQRTDTGAWSVPQSGVVFDPIEQTIDAPPVGEVTVKISILANGPGSGLLPSGGGAASFNLPVQAKLEASAGGAVLIGPDADCALRPVTFDLTGTYDEAAKTASLSSSSVAFPEVSAGCGGLGATINGLIGLPRSDIGISLDFAFEEIVGGGEVKPAAPAITSGPSGPVNSAAASFAFAGDAGSAFECQLDSGDWAACSSPKAYSGLGEGAHAFRVRQTNASNKTSDPSSRSWVVDMTAPGAPEITAGPSGTVGFSSTSISFTGETGATFACSLDNGPWEPCVSPKSYQSLADGDRTFRVRQTDVAGNTSTALATRSWKINSDTSASRLEATLTGGTLSLAALGEVELPAGQLKLSGQRAANGTWTVPQSGVLFEPIEQTIDAPGIGSVTVKISISATDTGTGVLPTGGGAASFNLPVQAKLEASIAGTPLIGPDMDCALRPVTFDLAGTYDQAGKKVSLSSSAVSFPKVSAGCGVLGGTVNSLLELPRSDIGITLNFALEEFGQLLAPEITSGPTGETTAKTASFAFTGENGATFECRIDGGAFEACTSPKEYSNLPVGAHTFEVRQIVSGGTVSEAASRTWTVVAEKTGKLQKPMVKTPKKVKSGKKVQVKAQVKNIGDGAVTNAKVCLTLKQAKKLATGKAKRCKTIKTIAAGKTVTVKFPIKTKKVAKNTKVKYTVTATYTTNGTANKKEFKGHVTLLK